MGDAGADQKNPAAPPMAVVTRDLHSTGIAAGQHERLVHGNGLKSFGLAANPFSKSSVGGSVPLLSSTQNAIAQLTQAIEGRNGLLVLTGEVGTGKSTVLNQLRAWLAKKSLPSAYLFNPLLDVHNFVDFVLAEYGIRPETGSAGSAFTQLSNWLFARYRERATAVLIIDEAQSLARSVLQALGPLMNLESSGEKLLQVVLAGQPELNEVLRRPEFRPLRQRIALRCRTSPLSLEETQAYVEARLRAAGSNGNAIFSPEALRAVHFYARGIPRVINLLCEHALTSACAEQMRVVPEDIIDRVARQFQFEDARPIAISLNDGSMDATLRAMRRRPVAHQSAAAAIASDAAPMKNESSVLHAVADKNPPTTTTAEPDAPIVLNVPAADRPVLVPASDRPVVLPLLPSLAPPRAVPSPGSSAARSYPARVTTLAPRPRSASFRERVSALLATSLRTLQASAKSQAQRDLRAALTLMGRQPNSPLTGGHNGFSVTNLFRDWKQTWASLVQWLNRPMQFRPRN
jgi:general secretion pathway protein A